MLASGIRLGSLCWPMDRWHLPKHIQSACNKASVINADEIFMAAWLDRLLFRGFLLATMAIDDALWLRNSACCSILWQLLIRLIQSPNY